MWNHESTTPLGMKFIHTVFFSFPGISMGLRYMFDADGNHNVPHREWVLDFKQATSEVRAMLQEQGREEEFIGAKVGEHTWHHS